jgi:hypothetical protein
LDFGFFEGDMYLDQQLNSPPPIYISYVDRNSSIFSSTLMMNSYLGGATSGNLPANTAFSFAPTMLGTYVGVNGESGFAFAINSGRLLTAIYDEQSHSIHTVATTLTGALDSTWDGDGEAIYSLSSLGIAGGIKFALSSAKFLGNGNLLLAGHACTNGNLSTSDSDIYLLRLTSTGAIDTTFGNAGVGNYPCTSVISDDLNPRIVLRSNGELYVVSQTGTSSDSAHCVRKQTATMTTRQVYDLNPGQSELPSNDVQFTATGRLVIAGVTNPTLANSGAMVGLIKP